MQSTKLNLALLIGASSGIGAGLARKLARENYQLTLLARREEKLQALCNGINFESQRRHAQSMAHDVTDFQSIPLLFDQIMGVMGGLDLIVYNSGILLPVGAQEFNFAKDLEVMETNILGAMAWLNLAAVYFQRRGTGQIVGISSVGGERGRKGAPAYNTSKAALNTYLESLRNRLSQHGVHVLTVKPGFIATEMLPQGQGFWVAPVHIAVNDIWNAIRTRKQEIYTPARWRWVAAFMRNMPSLYWRKVSQR